MLFLITEYEVITLAHEITLSIEHKNQFYEGIKLSISKIEKIELKLLSSVKYIIILSKIAPCMIVAVGRPTLYRSHIKVYRPAPLQKGISRKIKCGKVKKIDILDSCDIRIKKLKKDSS